MAASAPNVYRAIESLTPAELLKIREFAVWRIKGLGRKSNGRDHEDLMQEAVTRTVAGDRHWNEGSVSFAVHLLGAMRSISTHWAAQAAEDVHLSGSELDRAAPDERGNPVDRVAAPAGGPEAQLVIKEELAAIERLFVDDPAALRVLECVRSGLSGPETQETTGYSKTEYETVMKRIRRRVRRTPSRGECP
jgi:DNA-directed RNA polymerase specialized sigma24 family protein